QLAIGGIAERGVLDAGRLDPAAAGLHADRALAVEFALVPALEHVDHLEVDVVIVPLGNLLAAGRRDEADDMRLHHAAGGGADAEGAVFRVRTQSGGEVRPAVMAD